MEGTKMMDHMDQEPIDLAAAMALLSMAREEIKRSRRRQYLPADLVEEIREFLEDYSDVVDGEDGPRPNKAMALLSRIEEEVTR